MVNRNLSKNSWWNPKPILIQPSTQSATISTLRRTRGIWDLWHAKHMLSHWSTAALPPLFSNTWICWSSSWSEADSHETLAEANGIKNKNTTCLASLVVFSTLDGISSTLVESHRRSDTNHGDQDGSVSDTEDVLCPLRGTYLADSH